jgi:hypothetical protein
MPVTSSGMTELCERRAPLAKRAGNSLPTSGKSGRMNHLTVST